MPVFGRMSRSGGGAMDLHRIHGLGVLLLLFCLLWVEGIRRGGRSTFFNKVAAEDLGGLCKFQVLPPLLAGHGGKGKRGRSLAMLSHHLLAGLGGEGESGGDASLFVKAARSRSVDGSNCGEFLLLPSSLARHGGEMEVEEDEGALDGCYLVPTGCYVDELQQVAGNLAAAIHGRKGGASSTSDVEALNQLFHGCSKLSLWEVIRSPAWR